MSNIYENNIYTFQGTGSHGDARNFKIVDCPFGQYVIKVKLSETNEFIEVAEVAANKEFLDYKQKITPGGYHDVAQFYKDEK